MMGTMGTSEIGASAAVVARRMSRLADVTGAVDGLETPEIGAVLRVLRKSRGLPPSLAVTGNVNVNASLVNTAELGTRDIRISTLRWYLGEIVKAEPLSDTEARWLLMALTGGRMSVSAEDERDLRRAIKLTGWLSPRRPDAACDGKQSKERRSSGPSRGPNGRFAVGSGERVVGGTVDVLA